MYNLRTNAIPTDWFHGVFMYNGPNSGISLHINGGHIATATNPGAMGATLASGDIVVGRAYTLADGLYSDLTVDELYLWDEALRGTQIGDLYNWY